MNRTVRRLLLGVLGLAALAALGACGLFPQPSVVTLEVLGKRNAPTDASFVAVRDAFGDWQLTSSTYPGVYEIPTDGERRFSLALGCASDPPSVAVLQGTAGEISQLAVKCEAEEEEGGCGEEVISTALSPLAFLFSIDAVGVPEGEKAFAFFHGSPLPLTDASGPVNVSMGRDEVLFFTALAPEDPKSPGMPDPNGVTAFHWGTASSTSPAVHVVASGDGVNVMAPLEGHASFLGVGSDTVTTRATLKLPHEVRVPLGTASAAELAYHGVPDGLSKLTHEVATMLSATALGPAEEAGGQPVRTAQVNLASTAASPAMSVALPATAFGPVERSSDGALHWTAYNDPAAGSAEAYRVTATVGPAKTPSLVWTAIVTPGWLSPDPSREALDYQLPDLRDVRGLDSSWLIGPDATGSWELAAVMGQAADGSAMDLGTIMKGHGPEESGSMLLAAGRRGSF
ncbi:MAG: hypothetical protein P8Y13_16770 [Deinococcales bacterium]